LVERFTTEQKNTVFKAFERYKAKTEVQGAHFL
jgi:hypothetical protein